MPAIAGIFLSAVSMHISMQRLKMIIEAWVLWTLLAAGMQSVRTAGQKRLAEVVSPLTATLVRYLFGLPFAWLYLAFLAEQRNWQFPDLNPVFLWSGFLAGILQIGATILLVRLFAMRNFAVGTTFVRSEILLTALIGIAFFTEQISLLGWIAMFASVGGLILISVARQDGISSLWNLSAAFGLGAGLAFALTSLFLRQASLSLGLDDAAFSAGLTLVYMVTLQTVICLVMVGIQKPQELGQLKDLLKPSIFVGVTSVLGSAGWFTAMTLQSASYVKTLGQVEFLITLTLSIFYFKEKPTPMELLGMGLIVLGAVLLLLT
jgi:drug/metabolite transporter (DMT)-like permease